VRGIRISSSESRVQMGSRLRASRHAQGLTIDQVADATGLTKGFISRVERNETSPSVATLLTLCEVLSLPVGSLFEQTETALVTAAEAPRINMGGSGASEHLMTPRGQSRVQMIRTVMEVGATGGAELYTVNCDIEVLYVIRGRVAVRLPDSSVELEAGDALTLRGRDPHTWDNAAETESEVIWMLVPAPWSGAS
jgi:DNA-binding XRE family transcriptional regulator